MKIAVWGMLIYEIFVAGLILAEGFKVSPVPEWLLCTFIIGVGIYQGIMWWKVFKYHD
jgi:hypothetical protein